MLEKGAAFVVGIVLLVVVAVIGVGMWQFHWFMAEQNMNQQTKVNHNSQQFQDGLVSEERNSVQGYDVATDPGQKSQIKSTFCAVFDDLTQPPVDLVKAHGRICS